MEGTGELVEKWEVDEMMNDGDKNQDGMLDYEGAHLISSSCLHANSHVGNSFISFLNLLISSIMESSNPILKSLTNTGIVRWWW